MKTLHQKILSVLALSALPFLSSPVMAKMVSPCLDGNEATCIIETPLQYGVGYAIENNTEQRIFGWGVSNSALYGGSDTQHLGWSATYVDKKSWDGGQYSFEFYETDPYLPKDEQGTLAFAITDEPRPKPQGPTMVWTSGAQPQMQKGKYVEVQGQSLGSFESLFGTEDNGVSFFWNEYMDQSNLTNGVELAYNSFNGEVNTEFTTFGLQLGVVNVVTSSVSAVPEPETYAMFLAGLGLLGFAKRRKQSSLR